MEVKKNRQKNKKILVLGVSYKPNISDVRETPVEALIDGLRKKGAKVKWHDDIVKKWRGEKSAEIDNHDVAILAVAHDVIDKEKLKSSANYLFDCTGTIAGANGL